MKSIIKLFTLFFLLGQVHAFELQQFDLNVKVEDEQGQMHSLAKVVEKLPKDKPILMYLWASWCPDCMTEAPFLDNYLTKEGSKISILYFSVDKNRIDWLKKKKDTKENGASVRFPSGWSDNDFRKSLKLDWIPRYILMNHQGKVLHSYAIKISDTQLTDAIIKATK